MKKRSHIFISYKSQQWFYAYSLREQLMKWGYETWLDQFNLTPKDSWEDQYVWQHEIDSGLRAAQAVVAVVTEEAAQSRYVTSEWDIAIAKRIPFIALLHDPSPDYLPQKYSSITTIDFRNSPQEAFAELKNRLASELSQDVSNGDPFYKYLNNAFDSISLELGSSVIRTLTTYGNKGQASGEPFRLQAELWSENLTTKIQKLDADEEIDWNIIFNNSSRCVVLTGEAGSGKTTTLLNYARDAIVSRIQNPKLPLPIFIRAATWDAVNQPTLYEWIISKNSDLKPYSADVETLLFVDGLDELGAYRKNPDTLESFDPRQRFIDHITRNLRVVASCRSEDYNELERYLSQQKVFELLPLTNGQIQEYLRDQPHLYNLFLKDVHLQSLLRTPLLISIFAFAYDEMTVSEQNQFEKIDDPGTLRDKIFNLYITKRYKHEVKRTQEEMPFSLKEFVRVLGYAAQSNIENDFEPANEIRLGFGLLQGVRKILEERGIRFEDYRYGQNVSSVQEENYFAESTFRQQQTELFVDLAERLHILKRKPDDYTNDNTYLYHSYSFIHINLRDVLATSYLRPRLNDPHTKSARILGNLRDKRDFSILLNLIQDSNKSIEIRCSAIEGLGLLGDKRAFDLLLTFLQDANQDLQIRVAAAEAFGHLGDQRAVEPLITTLENRNTDWNLAKNAALSLGRLGGERATQSLINVIQGLYWAANLPQYAENKRMFNTLVEALKLAGKPAREHLTLNLNHKQSAAKLVSAAVLYEIGDENAIDPLFKLLEDKNPDIRVAAAHALSKLAPELALEALIKMLADRHIIIAGHPLAPDILLIDRVCNRVSCDLVRMNDRGTRAVKAWWVRKKRWWQFWRSSNSGVEEALTASKRSTQSDFMGFGSDAGELSDFKRNYPCK